MSWNSQDINGAWGVKRDAIKETVIELGFEGVEIWKMREGRKKKNFRPKVQVYKRTKDGDTPSLQCHCREGLKHDRRTEQGPATCIVSTQPISKHQPPPCLC